MHIVESMIMNHSYSGTLFKIFRVLKLYASKNGYFLTPVLCKVWLFFQHKITKCLWVKSYNWKRTQNRLLISIFAPFWAFAPVAQKEIERLILKRLGGETQTRQSSEIRKMTIFGDRKWRPQTIKVYKIFKIIHHS